MFRNVILPLTRRHLSWLRSSDGHTCLAAQKCSLQHHSGRWGARYISHRGDDRCGLFGYSELTQPEDLYTMLEECMSRSRELVQEAYMSASVYAAVSAFDSLSDTVCKLADMCECLRQLHPSQEYRHTADTVCHRVATFVEQLNTDTRLYRSLVQHSTVQPPDEETRWVARLFAHDFEMSGVHLESEWERERVVSLNEQILLDGHSFLVHTNDAVHIPASSLSDSLRSHLSAAAATSHTPDTYLLSGTMSHSHSEDVRRFAYCAYMQDNDQQRRLLESVVTNRYELAKLCGYSSFAQRCQSHSLARNPTNVLHFLNSTNEKLRRFSERDFTQMSVLKKSFSQRPLSVWDLGYICGQYEESRFSEDTDLSEFFSLETCLHGLSDILQQLFGITLCPVATKHGEVWSRNVRKLHVLDDSQSLLGYIYCDLFARSNKVRQDCHFTIRGGKRLNDGTYQLPIVVLSLNLCRPDVSGAVLLSDTEMENLFHEMGHAIHSMIARTRYQHVTGTRCSADFAEVPSVLMEYFARDVRVLSQFGRHYRTGDAVPISALRRKYPSSSGGGVFAAAECQLQLLYAALDQHVHSSTPHVQRETLAQLCHTYYPYLAQSIATAPGVSWYIRLSHLIGYGGRYYSYLLAEAIAAKIWRRFFSERPLDRQSGEWYRDKCLSPGGSIPAHQMLNNLFGHDVQLESLSDSVVEKFAV